MLPTITRSPHSGSLESLRRITLCLLVLGAVVTPERASAEPSAQTTAEPKEQWYGLPIVISDAAAIAVLGASVALEDASSRLVVGGASVLMYATGAPLVHLLKGEAGHAGSSFGLRLLPLIIGGPIVYANLDNRDMRPLAAGAVVISAGGLLAMIVDAVGLAWRPVPSREPSVAFVPSRTPDGSQTWTLTGTW